MDGLLRDHFSLFSQPLVTPENTERDLHADQGRIEYLKEIYQSNRQATQDVARTIVREIGRQLGILHGAGGNAGGHVEIHRLGKIQLVFEKDGEKRMVEITTDGKTYGRTNGLQDYKLIKIIPQQLGKKDKEKYLRNNWGQGGGGCTRPNNLGYGLRDLPSLYSCVDESRPLERLIAKYPKKVAGLKIKGLLKYFHAKVIQQADLDLLYVARVRDEVSAAGVSAVQEGAFIQLAKALGGGRELYDLIDQEFRQAYGKFYQLSRKKNAPEYFKEWDSNPDRPKLLVPYSCLEKESRDYIDTFLAS